MPDAIKKQIMDRVLANLGLMRAARLRSGQTFSEIIPMSSAKPLVLSYYDSVEHVHITDVVPRKQSTGFGIIEARVGSGVIGPARKAQRIPQRYPYLFLRKAFLNLFKSGLRVSSAVLRRTCNTMNNYETCWQKQCRGEHHEDAFHSLLQIFTHAKTVKLE